MTPRCRSCETLMSMSTLALTAFASWLQPLAKRRCRVGSHIAPNAFCCHCCHRWCHLCIVVVIAATPTIAVALYGTIWYYFTTPSPPPPPWPMPLLVLPAIVICHPPPVIRCPSSTACFCRKITISSRLSSMSPPALVALFTLPVLRHCPHCCCRNAPMQKL